MTEAQKIRCEVYGVCDDALCSISLFVTIAGTLPRHPSDKVDLWYDGGDYILCRTEEHANALADWLDVHGGYCSATGYFDPAEDEKDGCVDDHTGWWYVAV